MTTLLLAIIALPLLLDDIRIAFVIAMWACLFRVNTAPKEGIQKLRRVILQSKNRPAVVPLQIGRLASAVSSVSLSFSTSSNEDESNSLPSETEETNPAQQEIHLLDTTRSSQGRLVAALVPRSFVEHQQMKPDCRCDAAELLRLQATNISSENHAGYTMPQHDYACRVIGSFWSDDSWSTSEERLVILDVHLDVTPDDVKNDPPESDDLSMDEQIHLYLHMNRKAHEPAQRTLRRFEISMERRMKRETKVPGFGKRGPKRVQNHISSMSSRTDPLEAICTSVVSVPAGSTMDDKSSSDGDGNESVSKDGYRPLDISNMTSETLWKEIASKVDSNVNTRNSVLLSLSLGGLPMVFRVESCPPMILSVTSFDHFDSQLFVGVPLVVQTEVLNATRVVMSWFADGVEVCHDSPCYTPVQADVGKHLSVLIIPVRPGHDGEGHEEACECDLWCLP